MYEYKTIIFDLDGTLLKADTVFIDEVREMITGRGIELINRESIINLIIESSTRICRQVFGEKLSNKEIQLLSDELKIIKDKLFTKALQLYDGANDMLDSLKKEGYTLCIYCNGNKQYVSNVLETFGIRQYFTSIRTRVKGLKKYQLIKQILDENGSCSAIIVGSTNIDFEAADNTGCLSIGVAYGHEGNDYKNADFIADNPADIYKIVKKINGVYKDIAKEILYRKRENKPLIVGINGVDTSGKTTFTKELERYISKVGFKTQTILMDDFHNPSKIRNMENNPVTSYLNNAFDLIKVEKELMKPIILYGILDKELTLLDVEEDKFVKKKRYVIDKDTIVLFEGVLLYREPLNQYFDFRLFMDISFEEVLIRAKKRDGVLFGNEVIERYKKKYIPIQKLYIESCDPKNKSDVIISNEDYMNPQIIKKYDYNKEKIDRLEFEKVEKKHLSKICRMLEDDEAAEMLGVTELPKEKDYKDKNNISYAILDEKQEFIGIVELFNISWKNRRAELSIAIRPSMRGKGYGYEAIKKILDIGFEDHGMNRIWLRVLETNKKAIKFYKKIGFLQEGICRSESLRRGQFINQLQMSILIGEWIEQK
jgi:phosphoglycolate phosphatase